MSNFVLKLFSELLAVAYDKIRCRQITEYIYTFKEWSDMLKNCCRVLTTDVSLIRMISFALKHIAKIFFSNDRAPKCCGPGKLAYFSPSRRAWILLAYVCRFW